MVFRVTKPGLVCTRCFHPYLDAAVAEVDWPIEIYAAEVLNVSFPLRDELLRQSARALAVAEVLGVGGRVWFRDGVMGTSSPNMAYALNGRYTKAVL